MVSSNEASFNLREITPLPRNILHSLEINARTDTGQRTNPEVAIVPKGCRGRSCVTDQKAGKEGPGYSNPVRDTAKSGIGCCDNRHLNYLVESIFVNVGEPRKDAKGSSHPMPTGEVGAVIVVGGVTTTLGDGNADHRAKDRSLLGIQRGQADDL